LSRTEKRRVFDLINKRAKSVQYILKNKFLKSFMR